MCVWGLFTWCLHIGLKVVPGCLVSQMTARPQMSLERTACRWQVASGVTLTAQLPQHSFVHRCTHGCCSEKPLLIVGAGTSVTVVHGVCRDRELCVALFPVRSDVLQTYGVCGCGCRRMLCGCRHTQLIQLLWRVLSVNSLIDACGKLCVGVILKKKLRQVSVDGERSCGICFVSLCSAASASCSCSLSLPVHAVPCAPTSVEHTPS
jgi:hypothetical protein